MSAAPIVVGTDGSATANRAVEKARELAGALGAPVHVVMSCDSAVKVAMVAAAASYGPVITDDRAALVVAQQVVDHARAELTAEGIDTEVHVCAGDPADALITVAGDVDAQMIVVGNRGMSGARRVLGSVPNRVSHKATCAVLIVPTAD